MTHNHDLNYAINSENPSLEQQELEKRWPVALKELTALLQRVHDIRRENPKKLPEILSGQEKRQLIESLIESLLSDEQPQLKRSVLRRMANKIGNHFLWRRETSTPVLHELLVLLPWWISHIPNEIIPKLRDIGLRNILNGMIVPVQTVWEDILNAKMVFLGHCACRSAKVADDLYRNDMVYTYLSKEENKLLLDRIMNRYSELVKLHSKLPDTDPKFEKVFQKLAFLRQSNSEQYCIETLLESTYPNWEILPVLDKYTPSWIRSLHKNHKASMINKELCFELATILYLSKGIIFSSMKLIDTPYTICSCPSPESGGGCVLTNWYYYGMSNSSILPNESVYGRLKDESGNLLSCRFFPIRGKRECLGCGCKHDEPHPRDVSFIIKQADELLQKYHK